MPQVYRIRAGDNLSTIAQRFGLSVDALKRANNLSDASDITAGRSLTIPDRFQTDTPKSGPVVASAGNGQVGDGFVAPRATLVPGLAGASSTRQFDSSPDGTPIFRQGDPAWGHRMLGTGGATISRSGCAMVATAMAISKMSGQTVTPDALDHYLDTHHGYSGDGLRWNVAAGAAGLNLERAPWSLSRINSELDAGRPVMIGVDYKPGSNGGPNGTDHWLTLTHREQDSSGASVYYANDPALGRQVTFREVAGRLRSDTKNYKSTGVMEAFTDG
jgi:LysM repeat protein